MLTRTVFLMCCCVVLAGCGFHRQVANDFQSNSYVAYAPPRSVPEQTMWPECCGAKERSCTELKSPTLSPDTLEDTDSVIKKGDKLAVYLVGGYWNQNAETMAEDWLTFGKVRNEISIMVKVIESAARTDATLREVRDGDTASGGQHMFSGAQQTLIVRAGQVAERPIGVGAIPLYGPVVYNGGDLSIQILLNEMDDEDLKDYVRDIDTFLQENTFGTSDASMSGETVQGEFVFQTWGSYNIALAGYKALKLGGALYRSIHEQDDVFIDHAFTLTAPAKNKKIALPLLREGYYAVLRASINIDPAEYLKKAQFDPYTQRVVAGGEPLDQIWLILAVVRVDE